MKRFIQKLNNSFLAILMVFQTFGFMNVFAEQLEADYENKVIIGLNDNHMWSNDGGTTWQIGDENQRFMGNQVVQVAHRHADGIDIPAWEPRVYDGNQVGQLVRHEGNIYRLQWPADATDIPPQSVENPWDSPWLYVRVANINMINTFTFNVLEGEAAEQFQRDEAKRIQNQKKVIGYFANWQGYKTDIFPDNPSHLDVPGLLDGQGYDPVNVPMDKLTHVNYAFIVIDENGLPILHDPWADTLDENGAGRNYIGQLAQLTKQNDVAFMMSVGGWYNSIDGYFDIATGTPEKMEAFTDGLVAMVLEYEFDGVDIDWEFPENEDQKVRFVTLIKQLREKLTEAGMQRDKYYQLSAAVTANYEKMPYIDPSVVHPYLDSINVMSYDFRGAWEDKTGHHTPLYPRADDAEQKFNIAAAMDEYVNGYQVPKNKLMVGIGYYSRGWAGVESAEVGEPGFGPATGIWDDPDDKAGLNTWFHMKEMEQDPENIVSWDEESKVPYLYNPRTQEFFTYDNPRSVQYKTDYIIENDFGGAIIWELSNDTTDYELGSIVAAILDDEKRPELEVASSEGIKYTFIRTAGVCHRDPFYDYPDWWDPIDHADFDPAVTCSPDTADATIIDFDGSHRNVIIPRSVSNDGVSYSVNRINPGAFSNMELIRLEFQATFSLGSIGTGSFQGNPLQYINVPVGSADHMSRALQNGMRGVTINTILYEGTNPKYQWNGLDNWEPIVE